VTVGLLAGAGTIDVEESVLTLAAERCRAEHFVRAEGAGLLTLRRVPTSHAAWERLVSARLRGEEIGAVETLGEARLEANHIDARINESMWAAEAALRMAFQVAIGRQGGVLVHSSSVRFGTHVVVAVGQSTAGKSTLARLCREAGGELLSDEMTALFPDGTVYGTPFRSSDPTPGHPGPATLGLFVLLDKAPHEALSPLAPEKAMPRILEQVYRGYDGGELTPAKILERVAGAMNVCPPQLLSFRKDPEAGHFVRRYLEAL
jgi:hypothetical protein